MSGNLNATFSGQISIGSGATGVNFGQISEQHIVQPKRSGILPLAHANMPTNTRSMPASRQAQRLTAEEAAEDDDVVEADAAVAEGTTEQNENVSQGGVATEEVSVDRSILESNRLLGLENMYVVAQNIGNDWKRLARHFPGQPFTEANLDAIDHDNREKGLTEVSFKMIYEWKERCASRATVGVLAHTLISIGKSNIAAQLKP